jgi:hypothetical protein
MGIARLRGREFQPSDRAGAPAVAIIHQEFAEQYFPRRDPVGLRLQWDCHMLTYLALCARNGIHIVAYEDAATGTMETTADGGGRFTEVVLHPSVTIAQGDAGLAAALPDKAHALCFIASSVRCAGAP